MLSLLTECQKKDAGMMKGKERTYRSSNNSTVKAKVGTGANLGMAGVLAVDE